MRLLQVGGREGRRVVATDRGRSWYVRRARTIYDLAQTAMRRRTTLAKLVESLGSSGEADPAALYKAGKVLAPIDHPDPAHLFVTGTGLSH
ncbi:MAG TPA: FAH family protein, partial [Devosia sp.]|nr:FAH family protein [Devosia sp.]